MNATDSLCTDRLRGIIPYQFKPGNRANAGGRRKMSPEVKRLLIDGSLAAAQTLCEFVNDPKCAPGVRCQAAEILLDRVYGKASQPIGAAASGGEPITIQLTGILEEWAR
jgi:hypothetical protein